MVDATDGSRSTALHRAANAALKSPQSQTTRDLVDGIVPAAKADAKAAGAEAGEGIPGT
jgi:hypothetical protein